MQTFGRPAQDCIHSLQNTICHTPQPSSSSTISNKIRSRSSPWQRQAAQLPPQPLKAPPSWITDARIAAGNSIVTERLRRNYFRGTIQRLRRTTSSASCTSEGCCCGATRRTSTRWRCRQDCHPKRWSPHMGISTVNAPSLPPSLHPGDVHQGCGF
jgi:hypothetical protein